MSRICPITGKRPMSGNNVSHANNKTRRRWQPNLQKKRIWDAENSVFVTMRISTRALRTIQKLGLQGAIRKSKTAQKG